ncbi:MAG: dihydroneopterin aldolase [Alphaproteobacteria bacterium]
MTDRSNVTPLAPHTGTTASRRVFVNKLEVMAEIGVHAHEMGRKQPVIVTLDLGVTDAAAPLGDRLDTVLNYEWLVDMVEQTLARGHIQLVETLAEQLAAHCLEDARVLDVHVKIEKPDAFATAQSVGVELSCTRTS